MNSRVLHPEKRTDSVIESYNRESKIINEEKGHFFCRQATQQAPRW